MKRKHVDDVKVEAVSMDGAVGVGMGILLGPNEEAPNFVMRRFVIQRGGRTPYHSHDWEHEIYVVSGTGEARQGEETHVMNPGTVILAAPGEMHNFTNTSEGPLEFLCIVPRK